MSEKGPSSDVTATAEELLEEFTRHREAEPLDIPGGIPGLLYRSRRAIEAVTSATGRLSLVLVWVVFLLGLFNVVTRYIARFIQRDIIVGEVFDLQWMLFGALFLLGLNYGVREGVNPRIDFWWANFSNKRKAVIDLLFHVFLFLPFLVVAMRILWSYSLSGMGRSFDGSWSTWKVWEIWEQSTDAGGLPRGPIKLLMLLGFFLMATQVVAEIIKQILVLMDREDLAGVAMYEAPLRVE
ncbi:MAG: TRAP transporter small permease subunit [Acidimicrobiia bacterium]|nr:TRAP transporter small permease subunit [Acidimicrobiia bacterium]